MGINPIPTIAAIVFLRIIISLVTQAAYNVPGFSLLEAITLFNIFVIGIIPGMPPVLNSFIVVITTGTLLYAIAQLVRGA